MAFSWTDLIEPAVGLGGSLLGQKVQSGPATAGVRESAREFDIKNQRADAARQMLMPVLAKNLGQPSPAPMGAYGAAAYPQAQSGGGTPWGKIALAGGAAAAGIPLAKKLLSGGTKTAADVLGGAALKGATGVGGGAGMFSGLGSTLGAIAPFALPAAGVLGGIVAAKKIGQGRKAANRLTGAKGAQGEFGQIMSEVAKREQAGLYTPAQREQILARALDAKIQQAVGSVKNKNDQKVLGQWLGDFSKPEWQRDHPGLAAVAQRYLGSV